MVKITNGVNVFEVTRGAFDGIYSHQGYTIVSNETPAEIEEPAAPVKSEDEIFVDEVLEKPVSQWSKNEVKRFASIKEIDLAGTKNVDEAKELIKEFLDAEPQE